MPRIRTKPHFQVAVHLVWCSLRLLLRLSRETGYLYQKSVPLCLLPAPSSFLQPRYHPQFCFLPSFWWWLKFVSLRFPVWWFRFIQQSTIRMKEGKRFPWILLQAQSAVYFRPLFWAPIWIRAGQIIVLYSGECQWLRWFPHFQSSKWIMKEIPGLEFLGRKPSCNQSETHCGTFCF